MTRQQISDVRQWEYCPGCGAPPGADCTCGPGVHFIRAYAAVKDRVIGLEDLAPAMCGVITRLTVITPETTP